MIAESKDFKTITLRGLEEKENIVAIMNNVMKANGLKTGQSVIEFIIADYEKKVGELEYIKAKRNEEKLNYYRWTEKQENETNELKLTIKAIKYAFDRINNTEL